MEDLKVRRISASDEDDELKLKNVKVRERRKRYVQSVGAILMSLQERELA